MVRRKSRETLGVLNAFMVDPGVELFGLDISRVTGRPSGSLYPILARLEADGLLESRWEDADAAAHEGRRARRYYRLTGAGQAAARSELDAARRELHGGVVGWA